MVAIIGWIGVVTYLMAYVLLSMGRLSANTNKYHILNAIGGLCLVIHAYDHRDMPDLVVNLIWILIATSSVIRIILLRSKKEIKFLP